MAGGGSDSDDDMAFDNGPSTRQSSGSQVSSGGGFQKIAVKRDSETGEITGWQEFYNMARSDNPTLATEESKHTVMFNQAQE